MTAGMFTRWTMAACALVAVLNSAVAAAQPPTDGNGFVTGAGRLDGIPGPGLFAFEAVQRDGVLAGAVSRVFLSADGTTLVTERIGHVTCLRILDDRATMQYVVDHTNQAVAVGEILQVYAHDGGLLTGDGVVIGASGSNGENPTRCPRPNKSFVGFRPQGEVTIVATD